MSYLLLSADVFASRYSNVKVIVLMWKRCARARDVHESGKPSTMKEAIGDLPNKSYDPLLIVDDLDRNKLSMPKHQVSCQPQ